jgi:type VI secretion system secreted protein VgrG
MSDRLRLSFQSKDELSVRRFAVHEGLSELFEVDVIALAKSDHLDLEKIVGQPAAFEIYGGLLSSTTLDRIWQGVCRNIEQVQPEKTGLSTYHLVIVPRLWLLTQRRNNRIFQHQKLTDILTDLLGEWGIAPVTKYSQAYLKHEYVVQYGETDYAFFCRLCERAGITFYFEFEKGNVSLVLDDHPQDHPAVGPYPWTDNPNEGKHELVSMVQLFHQVRPGRFTIRDFDFRRKPDYQLLAEAKGDSKNELFFEQYHYEPGGSLEETGKPPPVLPFADDKGVARYDDGVLKTLADQSLLSIRRPKRVVSFVTNVVELMPGAVFSMKDHPRHDLGPDKHLLITELTLGGTNDGEWHYAGTAVFTDVRYVPDAVTPKRRIYGVESAIVVGPKGPEEIHTDEFGRVRVQFHWDRKGDFSDKSSCWMRVSQGWAGAGFGMIMLPRIDQEVLVGFFEGDPDQPVVVGRVYNGATRVPYKLPDFRSRSTWKSNSTPKSAGFNEIMFEDAKAQELIYVQAELDLQKLVKQMEMERTKEKRMTVVGGSRSEVVGKADATMVGKRFVVQMIDPPSPDDLKILPQEKPKVSAQKTLIDMIDGRVIFTTGQASIAFKGSDITIEADGDVTVKAKGSDVIIEGSTVYINSKSPPSAPTPKSVPAMDPGSVPTKPPDLKKPDAVQITAPPAPPSAAGAAPTFTPLTAPVVPAPPAPPPATPAPPPMMAPSKKPAVPQLTADFKCKPSLDAAEFKAQLKMAQDVLDTMTVEQWLANREAFRARKAEEAARGVKNPQGRDPAGTAAQRALKEKEVSALAAKLIKEQRKAGKTLGFDAAQALAEEQLKDKAALHKLDQIAGGSGTDLAPTLGDARVDFSMGAQWPKKADAMEAELKNLPDSAKKQKMNVKLTMNGQPI